MISRPEAALQLVSVTKRFEGLVALNDVSFAVRQSEILGLIGPNGAGKTTLFNVISGRLRPSVGQLFLDGQDVTRVPVHLRVRRGIAATFQIPRVFDELRVDEVLRAAIRYGGGVTNSSEAVRQLCESFELNPAREVRALSLHQLKQLEIARALATRPKVVLLDEVAAGLDDHERAVVEDTVIRLAEAGTTVVLVEHRMDFIRALCDRVVVLSFGQVLFDGDVESALSDKFVLNAYLGEPSAAT